MVTNRGRISHHNYEIRREEILGEEMVPSGAHSSPIFMLTNRGKICHHHYGIWEETLGEEMVPSKVHFPPHFLW